MQLVLRMIGGSTPGPVLRLPPGRYRFGRSRDCQVRFQERAVSRHHLAVTVGPADASVCDQGSRHGTVLNGRTITGEQALRDGDQLSLASSAFLVRLVADETDLGPEYVTVPGEPHGPPVEIPVPQGPEPACPAPGIGATVYIYGPGQWLGEGQRELECALDRLLDGAGYLAAVEDQGPEWGTDLVLHADADVEGWVSRLAVWLQE
ncbi:MAG TPA: FHA domain-containing protein [Gemmataceae bacterium]|nr:FHA domain-containing protein [Gemmataceae bacterium]